MTVSIKQEFQSFGAQQRIELQRALRAIENDLTALRTAITGITAQLDLDATVTDTDYAANNDPAALEITD